MDRRAAPRARASPAFSLRTTRRRRSSSPTRSSSCTKARSSRSARRRRSTTIRRPRSSPVFVGAANVIEGLVIGGRVQFGEQQLEGAGHLTDGDAAHAFVRPHDVLVSTRRSVGSSSPAVVAGLSDLGWISKVRLTLPDGQGLTAEVPNEQLDGVTEGQKVFVDLRNAKVFAPGGTVTPSDELAAV